MKALRQSTLKARLLHPGRKPRHELVDIKQFEKKDEEFLEFAQAALAINCGRVVHCRRHGNDVIPKVL